MTLTNQEIELLKRIKNLHVYCGRHTGILYVGNKATYHRKLLFRYDETTYKSSDFITYCLKDVIRYIQRNKNNLSTGTLSFRVEERSAVGYKVIMIGTLIGDAQEYQICSTPYPERAAMLRLILEKLIVAIVEGF